MPDLSDLMTTSRDRGEALDERVPDLRAWSDDPSAVLALGTDMRVFRAEGVPGFVAYQRSGRWLVQVGGAYAPDTQRPQLVARFRAFAAAQGARVIAVQLQRRDAQELAAAGYTVNQLGASYALPLSEFTLRGGKYVSLRNKISRARRAGVRVEVRRADELDEEQVNAIAHIDAEWLRAKGRFARPLKCLVGEIGGPGASLRRVALARLGDEVVGYVTLSPVHGSRPGWLHDLSRRGSAAPPGTMELVVSECLQSCVDEGVPWWHFGFTPFTSLDPGHEVPGASPVVARLVRLLAESGAPLYPAASQLEYKRKWGELDVLPDYLAFDGRPSPVGIFRLLRITNLI